MSYIGEVFLNKIYKELFNSEIVKHTGKGGNKNEDVKIYMDRLDKINKIALEYDKDLRLLKELYYKKYVIKKENIPDSHFKLQEKIAFERGYGHITYTNNIKEQEIENIINEQKASLDSWIEYFVSEETNYYPMWFKYFCFQGMIKLGEYDKEKDKYNKRTEKTVKPFIEINREAIAMVYDELIKVLGKNKLENEELEKLLKNGNFGKIYGYVIKILDSIHKIESKDDDGIWKKYLQGSDPNILFNDIHGKGTGWCTAGGLETAESHLKGGDFYVYYTKDDKDEYTNPRIAIRMEDDKIGEIRGISSNQNLESNMEKVVEEKLKEFPDREEYKKKVKDMEILTYIYTKWQNKIELTKEDLRFLYEIDSEIIGFGYSKDPRIKEIINNRNIKKDLSKVFECRENQISLTKEEALKGDIIYHYGDLYLNSLTTVEGLILPRYISGSLSLRSLTTAEGLMLPKKIGGDLAISSLATANYLVLPQKIDGDLYLSSLTTAKYLVLPEYIGRNIYLVSLITAKYLFLPQKIGGDLFLKSLTSAEDLIIPDELDCDLYCPLANNDINALKEMCKGIYKIKRNKKANHKKSKIKKS